MVFAVSSGANGVAGLVLDCGVGSKWADGVGRCFRGVLSVEGGLRN